MRLLLSLLMLYLPLSAHAMQDQMYGLGGSTTGRVGAVTAEPENAYASLLNPALLAATDKPLFGFSLGTMLARFDAPQNVILDSRKYRTRDGQDRSGTASLTPVGTLLMSAGYAHPMSLKVWPDHRLGLGVSMSGPIGQFRRWVALSPYDFTLLRYGAGDTQFKGTLSGALELIPRRLFVGGGISLFMTSNGISEADMTSENQTGRMAMDIAFNTAAVAGIYSVFGRTGLSLTYRQHINPIFRQRMEASLQVGGADVANQPTTIEGSLYYEPAVVEAEIQQNWSNVVASVGVAFQQWSQYQPRYLVVSTVDANGVPRSTLPVNIPTRDTWNPRASIEWRGWNKWRLAGGYQFRPLAVTDLSSAANLIDTQTHVTGLSIQRALGNVLFFEDLSLCAFAQVHWMSPRDIVKSEADTVGSPGYRIAGNAYTFGLSMTSSL